MGVEKLGLSFVILELEVYVWGRLLGESFHRRTGAINSGELRLSASVVGYDGCLG